MKKYTVICFVSVVLLLLFGCGKREESPQQSPQQSTNQSAATTASADIPGASKYEVLNTIEFKGSGNFRSQELGMMVVQKQPLVQNKAAYSFCFDADIEANQEKAFGNITSPCISVVRDTETERLTGGDTVLRIPAIVGNYALDQITEAITIDGTSQKRVFNFDVSPEFPQTISYEITGTPQTLEGGVEAVAVLAVSEPFDYCVPGTETVVQAKHQVLCVLNKAMDEVLYMCSSFSAQNDNGDEEESLRIESVMCGLDKENKPLSFKGLDAKFDEYLERMDFATEEPDPVSNIGMPLWAIHSLAVRDAADITAGAAIEGKPNFVILATLGTMLLADSAFSVATTLLHQTGYISWQWDGIPNYLGQRVGLGAAQSYEGLTGTADPEMEKRWAENVGTAYELYSIFLPSGAPKFSGAGLRITTSGAEKGLKFVKDERIAYRVGLVSRNLYRYGKPVDRMTQVCTRLERLENIKKAAEVAKLFKDFPAWAGIGENDVITNAQETLASDPDNKAVKDTLAAAYSHRAHEQYQNGGYEAAVEDYKLALNLDPNNKTIQDKLKKSEYLRTRLMPSEPPATNGSSNTQTPDNHVDEEHIRKGEYDEAIADYEKALQKMSYSDPNLKTLMDDLKAAYIARAEAKIKKGEYDSAIDDCDKALDIDPFYGYAYIIRGDAHCGKDEYDEAIDNYEKALQETSASDPHHKIAQDKMAAAYVSRAVVYYEKDEFDRAIADCTRSIAIDSTQGGAYNVRGLAYRFTSKWNEAVDDAEKATALDSTNKVFQDNLKKAYLSRAFNHNDNGEYDLAIADCNRAIGVDGGYALAYDTRAVSHTDKGLAAADGESELDAAIADEQKAIVLDPNEASYKPRLAICYYNRGVARANKREYPPAFDDLREAMKLDPNKAGMYKLQLALAYNKRGTEYSDEQHDYDSAIADYEKALELEPGDPLFLNNLAIVRENKRKAEEGAGGAP